MTTDAKRPGAKDAATGKWNEAIDKRRVTMRTVTVDPSWDGMGKPPVLTITAVDFVRPDFLDAYVLDARTRWQQVDVSEEPDAGPAGYHGETHVPGHLNHPLAGRTFAATKTEA